ncbi:hypothetical protein [Paenibacillus segetis]|uniref:YhfM-like domain-containing protein n=1 Tax=Paenibacillus segetis TaxID=1325360 RepID=A0ABQ1YC93_9BACL|nr:hypothetical protein [Paenibacillus segetis]GGH20030.1 hypothetical protein GCM10008013_17150 [Paenibacillus segetis]
MEGMIIIKRPIVILIVIGIAFVFIGWYFFGNSFSINSRDVKSITLECVQDCIGMDNRPFLEKTITDKHSINLFIKAINNSEKLSGSLDYGVMFLIRISFNNRTIKEFHLNISKNKEASNGLLVSSSNSEKGYRILEKSTNDLRDIIYND